jgi:hypothetical protein
MSALVVYGGFLFAEQEIYDWVSREGLFKFEAPRSTSQEDIDEARYEFCSDIETWLAGTGAPHFVVVGGSFPRVKPGSGEPSPYRYFFAAQQKPDPCGTYYDYEPLAEHEHTKNVKGWLEARGLPTSDTTTIPDIFDKTARCYRDLPGCRAVLRAYAGFLFDLQELYDWVNREGLFEAPLSTSEEDIERAYLAWYTFDDHLEAWLASADPPRVILQGGNFPHVKPGSEPSPYRFFFAAWQKSDPRATYYDCDQLPENEHTTKVKEWLEARGLKTHEMVTIPDIFDSIDPRTRFMRVAA